MSLQNTSFLDACRGHRPERTPVWLMRQAGRYLPEYRAIRAKVSFLELCRTPELAAEVTVQPIDRLGVDAAILFSDILVVFDAMDVAVEFKPGPVLPQPVRTRADIEGLRWGDPVAEVSYVMDAVRACKRALADRVPLIGFCGAPFTTCSYLIEGGGSRDFLEVKKLIFSAPELFRQLMANMSALLADYLIGQIDAGVDAVQIFDSWAGALGPRDYVEHVLPHTRALVERVQAHVPAGRERVPVILFARGNANLLAHTATIPADVLGVDWSIGMSEAIDIVGPERVVQGNLDPGVLLGPKALIHARAQEIVAAGARAKAHVFNLGHGISRVTDPEHAKAMVDAVHEAPTAKPRRHARL
ncbi:uroporphyrinogen decarboxylase [Pseudenhygromyxa sp. WMMC2535]|uniref:uroporphyrinogen decarboxylase n=1 Tax=Pseudenhygromyxa sp. WMMC2535 TaxID=2712867 RepID=UPI001555DFD2|nr:uroporphyrinogen decarboxylase [Pseudenhygromyxa sp. WMMC2535]NVB39353.1 uroporphyrinogen decarboxylase [Pseudenhygromyxa sp. WMMC2535]